MSTLVIGPVTLDDLQGQICPSPPYVPPSVRATLLEAVATSPENLIYTGTAASRVVRFACAESIGYCTAAQRDALVTLFLSVGVFSITTDLISPGAPVTYAGCRFDYGAGAPVFTNILYDRDHYAYDLVIRVSYA